MARPRPQRALQHLHALPTVITDGHLDAACTDDLAVGTKLAEAAVGAACGWGSFEFVLFRRCPYLSRHYGW
ncbi:hypothetical protein PIB30_065267 [Stylosanthes scabra]|uniref:Uncharacterized protein n=1 Tax=Stylosanthes scabra TaxID=79078 RepID=A0ABU6UL00_9FABA|nr:hypothetical protein [Stylosanthes scabra]